MSETRSIVVGAGLVGSLLSIYLAKRGHKVSVYEQRPDIRKSSVYGGRSINLALSTRGWTALDKVGLGDEIRSISIPMYGRHIHNLDGTEVFQPYGKENEAIYSVSRGDLNKKMISLAEQQDNVEVHFNHKLVKMDMKRNHLLMYDGDQDETFEVNADMIFGADGAFSRVRYGLQKTPLFNYSQEYLSHAYKELTIPAGPNGEYLIEKNALHIWPRGHFMLIALPNFDGSFTCTLFSPFEGKDSFSEIHNEQDVMNYFRKYFPDTIPLIPTLASDFLNNPTSSLVMVKCFPWHHEQVALIGDAAHAIVPFYGQGMNCGFEDVRVLDEMIDQFGTDWKALLEHYSIERKPDGDAILDLALQNFIEMRDLVADPKFLLRKKIEKKLNETLGDAFLPLYSMVTFSNIRYSEALREGHRQDKLLAEIMEQNDIESNWDSPATVQYAKAWLEKNK